MTKSTITDERITSVIERLEHYACNLKWTDVRGAQDLLTAADGLRELQERRKADSEPVAWRRFQETPTDGGYWILYDYKPNCSGVEPLYRHAQPAPVVPDDVLAALQKVARIRLDLNDFDGDRRGIADCLGDAEEALIEVVNRRAAMLAAAPQSPGSEPATVPGKWIPVSEQMPPSRHEVLVGRWWGEKPRWCCKWATYIPGHPDAQSSGWLIPGASWTPTHWMPLPAAPQEVKSE
ncbi:hypothetical protein B6I51_24880 [Klebsiella pneumoniae]|nr:DUF551 domain-containing protein [Klebsiella pneumoniae]PLD27981.1 hypothetical protein B6I51_24880 [Klebsiella pneumoniae]